MAIIKALSRFVRDRFTPVSVFVQPFLSRLNMLDFGEKVQARQLVKFYRHWIYVCASKNAQAVASVPLKLYVTTTAEQKASGKQYKYLRKGIDTKAVDLAVLKELQKRPGISRFLTKAVEVEEVTDHIFLTLWKKVNPYMNGFEMTESKQMFEELTGDSFLYVFSDSRLGVPSELWVLPSQYVTIVPSKENFVQGYLYGQNRQNAIALSPEEVVHFKFPNPNDLFYGYAPLQAVMAAAIRKDDMDAFEDSLLKNYARPDFTLQTKGRMRPGEAERLREEFQKLYGRRQGRGRPAVLEHGLEVKPLGFSPREMAFLRAQKFTREEILAAYGVPISKVTTEDVNLANAEVGEVQYQRDTILPRLRRTEDKLNEDLMPRYDERLFVAFENPVPENEEFILKQRDTDLKNYSKTINEVREEQGLEPVEYGDLPLVPIGVAPLGTPSPTPAVPPSARTVAAVAEPDFASIIDHDYSEPYSKDHAHSCCDGSPYEGKRNQFSNIAPPETKLREMIQIMKRYYAKLERVIMAAFSKSSADYASKDIPPEVADLSIDISQWSNILEEMFGPSVREQLARGGGIGMAQIGSEAAFDVLNPEVRAFIQRYVAHFGRITTQRLADRFANQMRISFDKGETLVQLRKRLQKMFGDLKRYKAEQIARSEASRAVHTGMIEAWKQSGVVTALIWDAQTDACPFCLAMDGTVIAIGQNFFNLNDSLSVVTGEGDEAREQTLRFSYEAVNAPPLHPNCVCTVRAIHKEAE